MQDLIRIKVFLLNISVLFLWAKLPQEETGLSVTSGGFFETLSSFSVLHCKMTTAHTKHREMEGSVHLKSCLCTDCSRSYSALKCIIFKPAKTPNPKLEQQILEEEAVPRSSCSRSFSSWLHWQRQLCPEAAGVGYSSLWIEANNSLYSLKK